MTSFVALLVLALKYQRTLNALFALKIELIKRWLSSASSITFCKVVHNHSPDSAHKRGAASPARLLHRLPSLNRVVPERPRASHRHRRTRRNVAVGPYGNPLRMHGRRVGLEVTELLLLLGVQPPLTTSLFWRLVKAAVLVGHRDGLTTCCHHWCMRKHLLLLGLLLMLLRELQLIQKRVKESNA